MHPVLIVTPWFKVYSYGFLIAVGYTLGTLWILKEASKEKLHVESVFDMLIMQLVIGIMGSRFLFLLEYSPQKLNLVDFFAFEEGGLTFYGSVISSFIFDFVYLRYKRMPFWRTMDCLGFGIPLGIAFARIGCLMNGCCYGTPTNVPWAVNLPKVLNGAVHPTQLYESLSALVIFASLQYFRQYRRNYGEAFLASMSLYGFFRFFIEFWRAENPIITLGMTLSQLIAIAIIALCYVCWLLIARGKKHRVLPQTDLKSTESS